jgi:dihydropteroate synthase
MKLHCGRRELDLTRPRVMGVLNVTPDSFSDGGCFDHPRMAIARARQMIAEGAAIIDVGGESTRPGARAVGAQEEMERVLPVIEALRGEVDAIISVDTSKPEVMRAAVEAGADMINDVRGFRDEASQAAAATLDAGLCVMHMQGEPRTMQEAPQYCEIVREVRAFLCERAEALEERGVDPERIMIDPGFGFGKTLEHNLLLLRELGAFGASGYPVLVGMSRKSMIGQVLDRPVDQRVSGSLAVASLATWLGASVIRAHDVAATVDAVTMVSAVRDGLPGEK